VPTVRKWVGRFLSQSEPGLRDASSRPQVSPAAIASKTALAIIELRRRYLTHAAIAWALGVSGSTVGRVLRRAKLARWSDLKPSEPVVRYEHACPGDLVHIDTKKLGRIEKMGHRVTGDRRDSTDGAGWEYLFVAVDDHARLGYTEMKANERGITASQFLRACVRYFGKLGLTVRRVLRQRFGFSLQAIWCRMSKTRTASRVHAALSTTNQRQGRAFHPVGLARMGLSHSLSTFFGAHRHAQSLDASLQLASAAPWNRPPRASQSPSSIPKQPVGASHLVLDSSRLPMYGYAGRVDMHKAYGWPRGSNRLPPKASALTSLALKSNGSGRSSRRSDVG
jgi:hypothetical protein